MPNFGLSLLLLLLSVFWNSGLAESVLHKNSRANIYKLCRKTSYPVLCIQYLSIFPKSITQNPKMIAKAALLVSLYRVQQTRLYIKKASTKFKHTKFEDYQVVKDCLEVFGDEVEDLSLSIIELYHLELGGQKKTDDDNCDIACHVSNIQNSLSASITDASTCVDEFEELFNRKRLGKVMATIKAKAVNAEQATTIALDLFCQYAKCAH